MADLVESVRLIEEHEDEAIHRWQIFMADAVGRLLPLHGGRLVKSLGDGLLVEFASVLPAIQCSMDMHVSIARSNHGRPTNECMCLRIGVHVTDVIVDDHDIYGSGVNLAARIATLAGPGEIVVTAEVRDQLVPDLDVDIEDLGECYVKHISSPVRAYKVGGQVNPLRSSCEVLTEKALQLTVAVIPFVGRLLSPHHSAIGDLIADSVIVHLSRQIGVRVISRLSTAALRDRHEAVVQARERLGATYVLAGSFSVLDERLLVTAEVIDTRSSDVVWAERISVELRDLVQEESELAHRLCTGTLLSIQRTEVLRARTQPLPSLESFCLQLGAVALMHRASRNDFERVHALLEHLVERHPRLPTPRAWLAKWHVLRVTRGMASDLEAEARSALSHTQRAVDSDPQCALALAVEGFVYCHMRRDLATAEQRYDAALEANPNESIAWLFKSVLHAFRGQGATAVEAAKHAIELSPLDPLRYYYDSLAASAALSAGDYDAALRLASRSLRANRTHTSTLRVLVMAQALSGRIESAKASAGELLKLEPGFTVSGFLRRSPSAEFEIGRRCAEALRLAGISE